MKLLTTSFALACIAAISFATEETKIEKQHKLAAENFSHDWSEQRKSPSQVHDDTYHNYKKINPHARPVIGILTEPLRGDLFEKGTLNGKVPDELMHGAKEEAVSYVPRAHVQFLEQAGIRVVPVDYRLPLEELRALYDQLNGVYLPGDSHNNKRSTQYQNAFMETMLYVEEEAFEKKEHFPAFLMGNSLQNLVSARATSPGNLDSMIPLKHESLQLQMEGHPDETFLFDQFSRDETQAVFNVAQFFNNQATGLTVEKMKRDATLKKLLHPVATFKTYGDSVEENFIAIAEGIKVPMYAVTYNVEMVQFYFEDMSKTKDQPVLDHSLIARKHAQTLANLFAQEVRMNDHTFEDPESVFEKLIRHEKIVGLAYESSYNTQIWSELDRTMPLGMASHDVYLLQ